MSGELLTTARDKEGDILLKVLETVAEVRVTVKAVEGNVALFESRLKSRLDVLDGKVDEAKELRHNYEEVRKDLDNMKAQLRGAWFVLTVFGAIAAAVIGLYGKAI